MPMPRFHRDSLFRSEPPGVSRIDSFSNIRHITPAVQKHLKLVYLTRFSSLLFCSFGAYLHIVWKIGGVLTLLGFLFCLFWLSVTPTFRMRMRFRLLMSSSVLHGATICSLIEFGFQINCGTVLATFVWTALVFACFSVVSIMTRRHGYLYLGGLLSSGILILLWERFASSLFGFSVGMLNAKIYFGMLVFLGYIVFDTQMTIGRASAGDFDYVKHALELFTDFIAAFLHTTITILLKYVFAKAERRRKTANS